jgi:hypothetical protein
MGFIRILEGEYDGAYTRAVMIDDGRGWSFGPMFDDAERCQEFQDWADVMHQIDDLRDVSASRLDDLHTQWLAWRELASKALDAELTRDERFEYDCLDARDQVIVRGEVGRMKDALLEFVRC